MGAQITTNNNDLDFKVKLISGLRSRDTRHFIFNGIIICRNCRIIILDYVIDK
jgi:hypothetical protein